MVVTWISIFGQQIREVYTEPDTVWVIQSHIPARRKPVRARAFTAAVC